MNGPKRSGHTSPATINRSHGGMSGRNPCRSLSATIRISRVGGSLPRSPLSIEHPDERFGIAERVVDRVMIVLGSPQALPLLGAAKIADQPGVEVGDASAGVPERVLAEVAPEVKVDPLEVVGRIIRAEDNGLPRYEPIAELAERLLGAVRAMERLGTALSKRVDVNCAELGHVAHGRCAHAEGRLAVN